MAIHYNFAQCDVHRRLIHPDMRSAMASRGNIECIVDKPAARISNEMVRSVDTENIGPVLERHTVQIRHRIIDYPDKHPALVDRYCNANSVHTKRDLVQTHSLDRNMDSRCIVARSRQTP